MRSGSEVLMVQKNNLRLISPVDGIVVERLADPGTTIVAGQSVIEVIDPAEANMVVAPGEVGQGRGYN